MAIWREDTRRAARSARSARAELRRRVAVPHDLQRRAARDDRDRDRAGAGLREGGRRASRSRCSRARRGRCCQGARLTAWELADAGIPVTVLPDGAAARAAGVAAAIDAVIVGCDRVAANGDVANKIGTFALAIAARHHGVPFYVPGRAPRWTRRRRRARTIEIEQRDAGELAVAPGAARLESGVRRHAGGAGDRADHRRRRPAAAVRARDRIRRIWRRGGGVLLDKMMAAHKFTFPVVYEVTASTTARISGCSSEPRARGDEHPALQRRVAARAARRRPPRRPRGAARARRRRRRRRASTRRRSRRCPPRSSARTRPPGTPAGRARRTRS